MCALSHLQRYSRSPPRRPRFGLARGVSCRSYVGNNIPQSSRQDDYAFTIISPRIYWLKPDVMMTSQAMIKP